MPIRRQEVAVVAVACFLSVGSVRAAPSINFPVNSQVPPVARVSQHFSFTFAASTFIASEEPITYSLLNQPSWLQFDNDTRTFSGEAALNQAGPTTFELFASDPSGSTSHEVTFIVTDQGGPQTAKALFSQLSTAGPTSAPSSLLLYPLDLFTITFAPDTFSNTTVETKFYATSADNSPLPSWLQFDLTSLGFSGTSPPLVSPTAKPQEYGVRLIASDIPGFAQAIATFQIVVGYHILAFGKTTQTVELLPGQTFESEGLRNSLTLDGISVPNAELTSITSDAPAWAELDSEQISLSGIPPQGATSQRVLIEAADIHGDIANSTINLVVSRSQGNLFNNSFEPVNAIIGQYFRYSIDSTTLLSNDVQVIADLSNVSSWLMYDVTSRTFSGSVPDDLQPGAVLITLDATLGSAIDHKQLVLNILKFSASSSSAHTSRGLPSSTEVPGPSDSSVPNNTANNPRGTDRRIVIVLGVLLPLLLLFCIGITVFCCGRRKRRHRGHSRQASENLISRPMPTSEPEHIDAPDVQTILQTKKTPTPKSPPRIELPWAPDSLRKSRERLSRITTNRESTLVDSGWGDFVIREPPVPARSSKRLERSSADMLETSGDWTPFVRSASSNNNLNYSRKRAPFRQTQSKVGKPSFSSRASKTLSGTSSVSVGLPVRLSGAGHGAGGPSPSGLHEVRRSWRHTLDSVDSEDDGTTPINLDAFPEPPGDQKKRQDEGREQTTKASIRLVPSSSTNSRSLTDQRQRWVRERAKDRLERGSRFSHTWSAKGPRGKGLDSSIESPRAAKAGSLDPDDTKGRNTRRSWSRSSSAGIPARSETLTRTKSPDSHLVRQPSNLRRALSTVSSGRFDSAESKSNSSWIDDLVEEEDKDGRRRWVAIDNTSQADVAMLNAEMREGGDSEQGSWGKNSRTGGLGALRANIHGIGPTVPSNERRWRLGGEQAKRPISVDEGELQRSQVSQRGNLAFV
jgi:axial budding pattern protein 2